MFKTAVSRENPTPFANVKPEDRAAVDALLAAHDALVAATDGNFRARSKIFSALTHLYVSAEALGWQEEIEIEVHFDDDGDIDYTSLDLTDAEEASAYEMLSSYLTDRAEYNRSRDEAWAEDAHDERLEGC